MARFSSLTLAMVFIVVIAVIPWIKESIMGMALSILVVSTAGYMYLKAIKGFKAWWKERHSK